METAFYVGDRLVRPRLYRIAGPQGTIQIEPKAMQVLVCLAEQAGNVVDRTRLLDEVWEDTLVVESTLNRCISDLRKAFDDDPHHPRVIETIRKKGYRLIAPVSFAVEAPTSGMPNAAPDTVPAIPNRKLTVPRRLAGALPVFLLILALLATEWWYLQSDPSPAAPIARALPFTSTPVREQAPALSPDGQQAVYAWAGPGGDNIDLYIKQHDAETLLRLTDDPAVDTHPAWHIHGSDIAFVRCSPDACGIHWVASIGGAVHKIADLNTRHTPHLSWSPDRRWIAYADRQAAGSPWTLYRVSVETGAKERLTSPDAAGIGDRYPEFRDDHTLAFVRTRFPGVEDLFLLDLATGRPARLTSDHRTIHGLIWTKSRENLIFASNRRGDFALWRLTPANPAPDRISALRTDQAHYPSVARSGYGLIYERWSVDADIAQRSLAHGSAPDARPRIASTSQDLQPVYSPDGSRVAFVSDRSGAPELWIDYSDGSEPVRLTAFTNLFVAEKPVLFNTACWSPDGRQLVFDARIEDQADLFVLDVERKVSRPLAETRTDEVTPLWSKDGAWIYFSSDRSGTWELWRMPAGGGEAVQITRQGGFAPHSAPDDRWIYYTRWNTAEIWRAAPDGTSATYLRTLPSGNGPGTWTVGQRGLYYVDSTGEPALVLYDPETQRTVRLGDLPAAAPGGGLSLAPDEQRLLYTVLARDESDLFFLNGFQN